MRFNLEPSQVNNSAIRYALLVEDLVNARTLPAPARMELIGRLADEYRANVEGTTGEATAKRQADEHEARRQRRIYADVRATRIERGE